MDSHLSLGEGVQHTAVQGTSSWDGEGGGGRWDEEGGEDGTIAGDIHFSQYCK